VRCAQAQKDQPFSRKLAKPWSRALSASQSALIKRMGYLIGEWLFSSMPETRAKSRYDAVAMNEQQRSIRRRSWRTTWAGQLSQMKKLVGFDGWVAYSAKVWISKRKMNYPVVQYDCSNTGYCNLRCVQVMFCMIVHRGSVQQSGWWKMMMLILQMIRRGRINSWSAVVSLHEAWKATMPMKPEPAALNTMYPPSRSSALHVISLHWSKS